ncbi:MAG: ABC transporter substrate-binding protein [Eubacteriales bacterium]|nr:ABC transporter substrate-binding protein [Eubacteriales bacterium]
MKKKLLAILLGTCLGAAMLTGCNSSSAASGSETAAETDGADQSSAAAQDAAEESDAPDSGTATEEGAAADSAADVSYTIGINQFAEHGSLDNCREGFLEGLRQEGIEEGVNLTVIYNNAATDMSTVQQISDNFVTDGVDLICAIATPSAQASYNAAMDTDIPVIYTAVTDPATAELASEDGTPVGNITGTSDVLPVEAQLQMIREMLPEAETIGILYTLSEANSEYSISVYESLADQYGFTIKTMGVTNTSEVQLAASSLLEEVDCISNLTDNTVVSALPTILSLANEKGIPVFGSEIEQVKLGCLAAEGLDYVQLGIDTGKMAAKVLKGEAAASELPFETVSGSSLYLNTEAAATLGITIPDALTERAAEVFDTISAE